MLHNSQKIYHQTNIGLNRNLGIRERDEIITKKLNTKINFQNHNVSSQHVARSAPFQQSLFPNRYSSPFTHNRSLSKVC